MSDHPAHILDIRRFPAGKDHEFTLIPDAGDMAAIRARLDLLALRKLRLQGKITPVGKADWQLSAQLGATVEQPCIVTLAPVMTRIDEPVTRLYLAVPDDASDDEEAEMPDDDSREPMPEMLDLLALAEEALALALPLYPRAEGAELGEAVFAADGVAPMRDQDTKPFAGLAGLKKRLQDGE